MSETDTAGGNQPVEDRGSGLHLETLLDSEPPEGFDLAPGYDLPKLRYARRVHPNPDSSSRLRRSQNRIDFDDGTSVGYSDDKEDMSVRWSGIAMETKYVGDFGPDWDGSTVCSLFRVAYNTHTSMLTIDIISNGTGGISQRVEGRVKLDTCYVDDPQALCEALAVFGRYPNTGQTSQSAADMAETLADIYENGTADALKLLVEGDVFDALA